MAQSIRHVRLHRTALALGLAAALALAPDPLALAGSSGQRSAPWPAGTGQPFGGSSFPKPLAERPHGGTVTVTNCNDSGAGSLRKALEDAGDGDLIDLTNLTCSKITLSSGGLFASQKNLDIAGPGMDALTIDADNSSRALNFSNKYDAGRPQDRITIFGMTVTKGKSNEGGCIHASGSLYLSDVRLEDCHVVPTNAEDAVAGGGAISGGWMFVVGSTISGNSVTALNGDARGGGVASRKRLTLAGSTLVQNSVVSLTGSAQGGGAYADVLDAVFSTIAGNEAGSRHGAARGGGAMFVAGPPSSPRHDRPAGFIPYNGVRFSRVEGNRALSKYNVAAGGAIHVGSVNGSEPQLGELLIEASTISGNSVESECASCIPHGGGVAVYGELTSDYSTFSGNTVTLASDSTGHARGGGIADSPALPATEGWLHVHNSTVSGNRVVAPAGMGGGIAASGRRLHVESSTVTLNSAPSSGGIHLAASVSDAQILSAIVATNAASAGADIGSAAGFTLDGSHNIINSAGATVVLPADTIFADPRLHPLGNYGGLTATHALGHCSPAIDAGAFAMPQAMPEGFPGHWDQRDAPYVRIYNGVSDIGAFEFQPDAELIFRNGFEVSPCP